MSEPTASVVTTETPDPQGDPAGDEPLGENGKKALESERAARATAEKTARELKAQLDAIEAANLSDLEKAQRDAQSARDELAAITRENLRSTVALTKGVPAGLAKYLTGDTEQEVSASADDLLAQAAQINASTTPRPDLTQATARDLAASAGPAADFARAMNAAAGR